MLGNSMATGFLKRLALPVLSLSALIAPVLAQESQPGSFGALPPIDMDAVVNGVGYIFGEPSGTTAELLGIKFLMFLLVMTIFTFLLTSDKVPIFKGNKPVGAIVGLILALIGVRFIPRDAVLTLAGTLGAGLSTAFVVGVPAAIVGYTYTTVKDKPYKWQAVGASSILAGFLLLVGNTTSLSIVRVFSGASLLSWILGISLIIMGGILFFRKSRVAAFANISQNTKTEVLADSRSMLRDVMYESKVDTKALTDLRRIEVLCGGAAATIDLSVNPTKKIYDESVNQLKTLIQMDYRETADHMARLRDEINVIHHTATNPGPPPAANPSAVMHFAWSQLNIILTEANALAADERLVFTALKSLETHMNSPTAPRGAIELAAREAYNWLLKEKALLSKMTPLIKQVESEIEKGGFA